MLVLRRNVGEVHSMCRQVCAPGFLMWHTEKPVELRSIELER